MGRGGESERQLCEVFRKENETEPCLKLYFIGSKQRVGVFMYKFKYTYTNVILKC